MGDGMDKGAGRGGYRERSSESKDLCIYGRPAEGMTKRSLGSNVRKFFHYANKTPIKCLR
jgi:hypothetical protein